MGAGQIVGCLPMSFNFSVRASAKSFTVPMVGIGLVVLSGLGLLRVVGSGLAGLPGLGGKEVISECSEGDSLSVLSDGEGVGEGDPLVSLQRGVEGLGGASLSISLEDEMDRVSVSFSLSFRVLSYLPLRGINLESSISSLAWQVGLGGVVGGWSLLCLGG